MSEWLGMSSVGIEDAGEIIGLTGRIINSIIEVDKISCADA